MGRRGAVGRHVHHERDRSSIVEEVDDGARATALVGGGKATVKVGKKVDHGAVVHSLVQDAVDGDADIGLGVVADDGSVDEEGQQGVLRRGIVDLEQGGGVVVTDGLIGRALSGGGASKGEGGERGTLEEHGEIG